ncbi:MAG TPA: NAD-dependent deacylase [Phototrophicaceae bacterium]|nr:NAD-dependent deacylase [Phototrophicaceae bacterium]
MDDLIRDAATYLRHSQQLTVLTGAGISKESGIPTFRDALDGLWAQFDPTQLATRQAFSDNPKLVWDFYEYRRELMRPAQPNPGHYALAELQRRLPHLRIITQNVDDLHERAGNTDIIRLHGRISANKCFFNCQGEPTPVDVSKLGWDHEKGLPACPHCGRWVRPDVVWFGEMLPTAALQAAKERLDHTDVMLVIGTSGLVSPAADMPYHAKTVNGAVIIEINPDDSAITRLADIKLSGPSGEVLPRLLASLDE